MSDSPGRPKLKKRISENDNTQFGTIRVPSKPTREDSSLSSPVKRSLTISKNSGLTSEYKLTSQNSSPQLLRISEKQSTPYSMRRGFSDSDTVQRAQSESDVGGKSKEKKKDEEEDKREEMKRPRKGSLLFSNSGKGMHKTGSLRNMLSQLRTKKPTLSDPKIAIVMIRTKQASINELQECRSLFSNPVYLSSLLSENLFQELTAWILFLLNSQNEKDYDLLVELISCLRDSIPSVAMQKPNEEQTECFLNLTSLLDHHDPKVRSLFIEILSYSSKASSEGSKWAMEGLNKYSNGKSLKETYFPFISILHPRVATPSSQANCISFLNNVFTNLEDIEERCTLENTLLSIGLHNSLRLLRQSENTNDQLSLEIGLILETIADDFSLSVSQNGSKPIRDRAISMRDEEESSPESKIQVIHEDLIEPVFFSLEWNNKMTVYEFLSPLKDKLPLDEVVPYLLDEKDSHIMNMDNQLKIYSLSSHSVVSLRPKPSQVTLWKYCDRQLTDRSSFSVQPLLTGRDVLINALEIFKMNRHEFENYGLYAITEVDSEREKECILEKLTISEKSFWIKESSRVEKKFQKKNCHVLLRRRPIHMKVKWGKENWELGIEVEEIQTVGITITQILEKLSLSLEQKSEYALTKSSDSFDYLDESLSINTILEETQVLYLKRRGRYVSVIFHHGKHELKAFIELSTTVEELISISCKEASLDPLIHTLISEGETVTSLRNHDKFELVEIDHTLETQEKNIWEINFEKEFRRDEKGEVLSGSINSLVIYLTHEDEHDLDYTRTFLYTYRSFTTPDTLLKKLKERMQVPEDLDEVVKQKIKQRVIIAFKNWIEFYSTRYSDGLLDRFEEIERDISNDPTLQKFSPILRTSLNKQKEEAQRIEEYEQQIQTERRGTKNLGFDIWAMDELQIAEQLTILEFEVFSKIQSTEFFGQGWNKKNGRELAPNIMKMIDNFNNVACWVASSIVQVKKLKERVARMIAHIKIANHLRSLNNFHLVTAVISGLNNHAVLRLKHSREKLPKTFVQIMERLEAETTMEASFKNLRQAVLKARQPVIPYIGVYLMDLLFIEEGNPDNFGSFINFRKRKQVFEIIQTIQKCQQTGYAIKAEPHFEYLRKTFVNYDDKKLTEHSLECEPRGASKASIR